MPYSWVVYHTGLQSRENRSQSPHLCIHPVTWCVCLILAAEPVLWTWLDPLPTSFHLLCSPALNLRTGQGHDHFPGLCLASGVSCTWVGIGPRLPNWHELQAKKKNVLLWNKGSVANCNSSSGRFSEAWTHIALLTLFLGAWEFKRGLQLFWVYYYSVNSPWKPSALIMIRRPVQMRLFFTPYLKPLVLDQWVTFKLQPSVRIIQAIWKHTNSWALSLQFLNS